MAVLERPVYGLVSRGGPRLVRRGLIALTILAAAVAAAIAMGLATGQRPATSAALDPAPGPRPGASPVIVKYWGTIMEAARRHNKLDVSNFAFAQLMEQMITVEQGGDVCNGRRICASEWWYPFWSRMQATTNDERGTNASVGLGQIRPETALQLNQGWIKHGNQIVYHGVIPAYRVVDAAGQVQSALLARPEVSIEYLAANLEMGTAVARYFGYEPSLDDLARWHNTGVGWWTIHLERVPESIWLKGTAYVEKVRLAGFQLANPDLETHLERRP